MEETIEIMQEKKNSKIEIIHWLFHICTLVTITILLTFLALETKSNATHSLADAINLLPKPHQALGGKKMSDDYYWVWTRKNEKENLEQSWIVNVSNKTATLASEQGGSPFGGNEMKFSYDDTYLRVYWDDGWDGYYDRTEEIFNRSTGELAYTLTWNSNNNIAIKSKENHLKIEYEPKGICFTDENIRENHTTTATGLRINESVYPFPKPLTVECDNMEYAGHDDLRFISFSSIDNKFEIGLAEYNSAHISAENLDAPVVNYYFRK